MRQQTPDIVLLDYGLPDITGLDVIDRIRSFSSVYILLLTGHEELAQALLVAGADAVLTKPFRPRALRAHVEAGLGLKQEQL